MPDGLVRRAKGEGRMTMLAPWLVLAAVGVAGGPPADDGRQAYCARPWTESAIRDATETDCEVWADERRVPLYVADVDQSVPAWGGNYCFGSFTVADRPVRVRVKVPRGCSSAVQILPARYGIRPETNAFGEVTFAVPRPMRLTLEWDGRRRPLAVFANPPECDVPKPGDAGVVWFGPGYHFSGRIRLGSNETLYLASGAVVMGGIEVRGTNVTVRGRGILDGAPFPRFQGPTRWMLDFTGCRGVRVEGITIRNPFNWVLVFLDCEDVSVSNVKVCGSRMINDDALDICNSRRVVVRDSFFRCADDVFALKGNLPFGKMPTALENVRIEDCVAWTDAANVFRVGFECNASRLRRIVARRIDVLHVAANQRDIVHDWANCVFYLQPANDVEISDVLFDDVRIRHEGPFALFSAYSHAWGCLGRPYETAGRLRKVCLRNVVVTGDGPAYVLLRGDSDARDVARIAFENVTVGNRLLSRHSPDVTLGPFVRNVVFK